MSTADKIHQEVKQLPEPLAREVLDFIGYIEFKYRLVGSQIDELAIAQEPVMKRIWDNQQDEIWNEL
jgi:hypothetical protein